MILDSARVVLVFSLVLFAAGNPVTSNTDQLPIVDLGYEIHQAAFYNSTGDYYNFTNIRYAAPPIGSLRFAAPVKPSVDRSKVQTGSQIRICPQSSPEWLAESVTDMFEYLYHINASWPGVFVNPDPNESEDCLFLDVAVPRTIFEQAGRGQGAPVLIWIYGGAYTAGSKSNIANSPPSGLLRHGGNDFIYVAINYRLGAFGWMSGPTFRKSGTQNAGLLDQRLALEWVQQYIHFFGGDSHRVTVMGESSGGGSIVHQITAYGGARGPVPFQRAILQSPGFTPGVSDYQQEASFQRFLSLLNVSTLDEARKLPSSALIAANYHESTYDAAFGTTKWGPVVDGSFVPQFPGLLILDGKFDRGVSVMYGHTANDGLLFTNLSISDDVEYRAQIQSELPTIQPWALDYVASKLYPPTFDGSAGYVDQIGRTETTVQDLILSCNGMYFTEALGGKTYNYVFAVPPALHGMDVEYVFYNDGGNSSSVESPEIAEAMQEYITSFVVNGEPSLQELRSVPMYGDDGNLVIFNATGVEIQKDSKLERERCAWWQRGFFL